MILRSVKLALALAVGAALLAPLAAADKPGREPVPFDDATGAYCTDFDVLVHATDNKGTAHIFSTGAVLATGTLKVEVTNLETGKTIAVNVSGPARFSSDGSTLKGTGRWIFFGEEGFFGPGSPPRLTANSGAFTIDLADASIVEPPAHVVDLCPLLADS